MTPDPITTIIESVHTLKGPNHMATLPKSHLIQMNLTNTLLLLSGLAVTYGASVKTAPNRSNIASRAGSSELAKENLAEAQDAFDRAYAKLKAARDALDSVNDEFDYRVKRVAWEKEGRAFGEAEQVWDRALDAMAETKIA